MCGIVGYLSLGAPIAEDLIIRMRDTLSRRGPDSAGLWRSDDGRVALGHRRLAIVDLSPTGEQPMWSGDGRYIIVYNGELYNHHDLREELRLKGHSFRGASDTEVLLAAWREWGVGALDRFFGMFAFAIYDVEAGRLTMARDRAGEKPLFYHRGNGHFGFASELKALLAHPDMPRRIDRGALEQYLAYGYVPRDLCILEGYAKLGAGHYLEYDFRIDRLEVKRYWSLPVWQGGPERPWDELVEEFEPLFDRAVGRQLLADVPVGVLLSGGLDSSLVAEAARRSTKQVTTFTIGFPGHGKTDESPIARRLANELGTEHVEMMVDDDTVDLLPQLAEQFDEPIADSSMIPTYIVSKLVRTRATVALGGDGGDELFGGYLQYSGARSMAALRSARLHLLPVKGLAGAAFSDGSRYRKTVMRLLDAAPASVTLSRLADPAQRKRLSAGGRSSRDAEDMRQALIAGRSDVRDQVMALDFMTYMCDDVLVKVDRASMLTSLEVRAPLLDHSIIEFAFGALSPAQRVSNGQRKMLLRKVARRRLPSWFDVARKQGFSIPLSTWLKGAWSPIVEDLANLPSGGLLDPAGVRRFVRSAATSERLAHQVFQLAILQLWAERYRVTLD